MTTGIFKLCLKGRQKYKHGHDGKQELLGIVLQEYVSLLSVTRSTSLNLNIVT